MSLESKEINIRPIPKKEYEAWVKYKHYAGRLCSIEICFGLFINKDLEGICSFGQSPSPSLSKSICGEDFVQDVLELNRLFTNDNLPKNILSFFVSQCIKKLSKPKIIVSFADANMNHSGYIYQATNFIYTGETTNNFIWIDKNNEEFHFRKLGHLQKNNSLNVSLKKVRKDESQINKIEFANFLKKHKSKFTAKDLDKICNHKDTASHWFRTDAGFSFPSIEDYKILKKVLNLPDTYDAVMLDYVLVADTKQIIKKLGLKKQIVKPKHRYIFFHGDKRQRKEYQENFLLSKENYPKKKNINYSVNKENFQQQKELF
tara:strand:+ start:1289 stop:2239 length:951 start_codon:yes stop_codon:yes gene_type:complete